MQFIRRRYALLLALLASPVGLFLTTAAAHAGENWGR